MTACGLVAAKVERADKNRNLMMQQAVGRELAQVLVWYVHSRPGQLPQLPAIVRESCAAPGSGGERETEDLAVLCQNDQLNPFVQDWRAAGSRRLRHNPSWGPGYLLPAYVSLAPVWPVCPKHAATLPAAEAALHHRL